MVSRCVFLEVMRIVRFHHAGHLNSFAVDEEVVYRKLRRAWDITRAADNLIYGVYDQEGYREAPDVVPAFIAVDAIREIREFLPALVAGLIEYDDVELKVRWAFQASCRAFDDARHQVQDLAWQVIFDARVLTIEPLTRAARLLRGHRLASPLGHRYGITPSATVVSELRAIIPDHVADLVDSLQIFDRVLVAHSAAIDWCLGHPHPLHRRRVFLNKDNEYPGGREYSDICIIAWMHPSLPC